MAGRWFRPCVLLLLAVMFSHQVAAQGLEKRVKAAYIFNFTHFIDWSESAFETPSSPLQLCIAGDREVAVAVNSLIHNKKKNQRDLSNKLVLRPEDALDCHVLYIAVNSDKTLLRWLQALPGRHMLTIADGSSFVDDGGVVGFTIVDGKLRFDISQLNAQRAELQISSKLLSLARQVRRNPSSSEL